MAEAKEKIAQTTSETEALKAQVAAEALHSASGSHQSRSTQCTSASSVQYHFHVNAVQGPGRVSDCSVIA